MPLLDYNLENRKKRENLMGSESQRYIEAGHLEVSERLSRSALLNPESFAENLTDEDYARFGKERIKEREHGVLGEFAAGLGRGALRVVATPAYLADIAGEAVGWKGLERAGEIGAEKVEKFIAESPRLKKSESISKDILKSPELWTDPRWYSSLVGEGLPTILSMLVPGMAAARAARLAGYGVKGVQTARIAGGLGAAMGLEAGGAAEDIRQYEKTGEKIPISTKLQSVLGTGVVAGSLEYVPIFTIFGRTGAQKLIKRIITGIVTEGSTEGAQELVANAFAKVGYDADRNMVGGVVESVVGGVLLGGGMGAISRATNFQERIKETDPNEVANILEQVEKETTDRNIINMIDEGMTTGEIAGEVFTPEVAMAVIKDAYADKTLTDEDLDYFKEKYPDLGPGLNDLIGENLKGKIDEEMKTAETIERKAEEAYRRTPEGRQAIIEAEMSAPTEPKAKIVRKPEIAEKLPERRIDIERRKRISEMTEKEMRKELLINPVTEIPNKRAYQEKEQVDLEQGKVSVKTYIDVDSLKYVNDFGGHVAGDELLKIIAKELESITPESYHIGGDEFIIRAGTEEDAKVLIDKLNERLSKAEIEFTNEKDDKFTYKGLGISYGIHKEEGRADELLREHKKKREAERIRAKRGERPPGLREVHPRKDREREGKIVEEIIPVKEVVAEKVEEVTSFEDLPERAKGAIASDAMVKGQKSEEFIHSEWIQETINIESLKDKNKSVWGDSFIYRKSKSKDPLIVSVDGEVLDGNNRLREAIDKNDKTIEILRRIPTKPLPPKPPKAKPPEAVREEIKGEVIPEVKPKTWESEFAETYKKSEFPEVERWDEFKAFSKKEYAEGFPVSEHFEVWMAKPYPKVEKEKVEIETEQLGKVWIKNIQKPIMSAREITKGKNKGKYEVVLTRGRDAEGNIKAGLKRVVAKDDIVTMPGEKPTAVEAPEEKLFATKAIKPQDTITRADLKSIFAKMKNISTGQDKDGNFFFRPFGKPVVTIHEVNHIEGYIDTSKGRIPVGSFLGNTIELKTGGEGHTADIGTAWHEFTHYLEKNDILSGNDVKALNGVIAKAEGISENKVTEEHRATYVGDRLAVWQAQKNLRIRRVLKKVADFVNAIYEFVSRTRAARGVLADIETGRILSEEELAGVDEFVQERSMATKYTSEQKENVVGMYRKGKNTYEVSKETGVPVWTVKRWVKKAGITRSISESKGTDKKDIIVAIQLYNDGLSSGEIAEQLGYFPSTILKWLHKSDIKVGRLERMQNKLNKVADLYTEGMSTRTIAKALGLSRDTVSGQLKKAGITARSHSEAQSLVVAYGRQYTKGLRAKVVLKDGSMINADSLYEAARIQQLENDKTVKSIQRITTPVKMDNGKRYTPDLLIKLKNGKIIIEEIKPLYKVNYETVIKKANAAKHYYGDKCEYRIITERDIGADGFDQFSIDKIKASPEQIKKIKNALRSAKIMAKRALETGIKYQMAGASAIGAPTGQLVKAQEMLAEGKDKKEVWRETGWMRGVEGKWKFEIDDSGAKFDWGFLAILKAATKREVKLNTVLKHPELYKAYPMLKDIDVYWDKDLDANAAYGERTIVLNPTMIVSKKESKDLLDITRTQILHEVQHAIQEIQGFVRGGIPETSDLAGGMVSYLNLAGEIEARDTLDRAKLTPEQRREQMPYESQGIPEDQWIITEGEGTSFSISETKQFATKPTVDYKEMLKRYQKAEVLPPKIASAYEKDKDDWFGNKDWAEVQHAIERDKLQNDVRDTVSVKKNIFGKKIFDRESRDVGAAIHLYLDLKRNPSHRAEFYKDLPIEWKRIVNKIDLIEPNPKLKAIADHIREQGDATGKIALEADVIHNQIENHVNRLWKKRAGVSEKVYTDALQKFKTKSRHAKHRVFDTILEGLALKDKNGKHIFDLQIKDAASNLQVLKDEISRVIEDKKLITEMRKMKTEDGDPLLSTHRVNDTYVRIEHPNFKVWEFATGIDLIEKEIDESTGLSIGDSIRAKDRGNIGKVVTITDESVDIYFVNKKEGTEKTVSFKKDTVGKLERPLIKVNPKGRNFFITDEGTILEKRELYAPEKIARDLNKILGVSRLKGVRILGVPAIDTLTKYNAIFKSWILVTSFFHHQAFLRSYYLPSQHKTRAEWNPFKAYKMGKKAIADMTPEIELLVRNGLTMFKMQDWEESVLRREDTIFGKILDRNTTSKAIKDKINELRERQANFLFGNFGAALKTQAALIELRNMTRKHPDMDVQERAKMVARLINDDFGGLHLGRMGRDPTIQHIMRLGLLAPDWCVDPKTRAMTKTGWKYYHELKIGDEIMMFDPKTKKNRWGELNDMYVNENYNGKMVQVKNFNRSVMMTPEHTCYVYNSTTKRNDIVKACELQTNHQIPRCADFDLTKKEIYDDTYIKLVGWFVTDGYTKTSINKLSDGSKKEYKYGKIAQSKPDMVAILQQFGMKEHTDSKYWNHDKFKANHYKHTFTIPEKHFKQMQKDNLCAGLNWKFLNKLSMRHLQLLYDTMMLGDGTGWKRFCGKEKEVFYMTLIQTMLGLPSTFWQQEENCWRTRWITRGKGICCWGHHNNKVEVDYKGTIWCPSVDTGFWLAEREGLMFITGNSESNVRTMVKAFRSRGGPEETAMYRRFWTSTVTKGLSMIFVANILMSAFDDDDFEERYKKSWKVGHHRWLDIDITPVYRMFGGKTEARKYFSLFGHFRDPLKFMAHPIRSLHHKGSVVYGVFHEAMSGVDWKGQRFTTLSELIGVDDKGVYLTTTKTHKAGDPKGSKLAGKLVTYGSKGPISLEQMPSYIASQLIGVQPIQIQNLIAMLTGEVAAFDGIARSLGMHTGTTYPTRKSIREEFIIEYIKLRLAKKSLGNLRKKVNKYNLKYKDDKENIIPWESIIKTGFKRIIIERQELQKYRRK